MTGAFPNLLESIVVRGNVAYVPNTCESPNGPFRFNVNVPGCLSTVDVNRRAEAFATWQLLAVVGLSHARMRGESRGMLAVEQHLDSRRELDEGDAVSIRSRVLDLRGKDSVISGSGLAF